MIAKLEKTLQFQHNIGLMDKMIPTNDLTFNKEVRGNVPNSQEAKAKVPGVQQR